MTKEIKFDPLVWANWVEKFEAEEEENYHDTPAEEPAVAIPEHDLMDAKEVCTKLRWSLSTLKRNTKARKLGYIKRDGKLMFKRVDVERYDKKRYVSEK